MTGTNSQIINIKKVKVVGYCHRLQQPLLDCDPVWVANQDDILCSHFNARRLVFCSKDCLKRTMESVLAQINGDL